MAEELKEYTVVINGIEHQLLLSDEDAKSRGLKAADKPASNKARTPTNK